MVYDWQREAAILKRKWKKADAFRWPDPARIGLELEDQNRVAAVRPKSAAARVGLQKGDVIVRAGLQHVRTFGDIQRALDAAPKGAGSIALSWKRGRNAGAAQLALTKNWRVPDAPDFGWRNSMWQMSPQPGFGGKPLNAAQLAANGLPADKWAMCVGYLVTWGRSAYVGRNAHKAGLRKGDIIFRVDGKNDFDTKDDRHFQSWFRFTHKPGDKVKMEIIRRGKREKITLTAVK